MRPLLPIRITPRRLGNLALNGMSFLLSAATGRAVYWGAPWAASIEPANFCGLHCPHCPTGRGEIDKRPRLLPLDDYRRVFGQLAPTLLYLNLYFQGEPTLNGQLARMVAMARRAGVYTCVSTNGQRLDRAMAEALSKAGLNRLIVDLDGADEASYQAYRRGGTLQAASDAIRAAAEAGLNVEAQCLLLSTTQRQKEAVRTLALRLGARRVTFKTAQLYDEYLAPDDGPDSRYRHTACGLERKKRLKPYCRRLWRGVVVDVYGRVLPCCFDKDASHVWGDLLRGTLAEATRSAAARDFRQTLLRDRPSIPICRGCCE